MTGSDRQRWLTTLDDYTSGTLGDAEAAAVEEDLFARAAGPEPDEEAVFLDAFYRDAAWMNLHFFCFRGGSTRTQVDDLIASGKRVFYQEIGTAGAVTQLVPWPEDTRFVITRLGADLRGYSDVEVDIGIDENTVFKTFHDCEYDPADGSLYAVCHEPLARLAFTLPRLVVKIHGTRDGKRETVASYEARNT